MQGPNIPIGKQPNCLPIEQAKDIPVPNDNQHPLRHNQLYYKLLNKKFDQKRIHQIPIHRHDNSHTPADSYHSKSMTIRIPGLVRFHRPEQELYNLFYEQLRELDPFRMQMSISMDVL